MNSDFIPKLSIINVKNLRLRAYIGFMDWEKKKLQDLVISYSFKYNVNHAVENDDIKNAVDYKIINKEIIKLIDNQRFHLIEYVAEKIFQLIQNTTPEIQNIKVKVQKPHALRFADNVAVKISGADRYNTVIVALGSNIHPDENFEKALNLIQRLGIIVQRTAFIVTHPLKFEDQPDFLNGAVLLLSKKSLPMLQFELKQMEAILGRVRTENKNAPRVIDLDIITYNGFIIDSDLNELPFLTRFIKELQPEISLGN